jgi:hypothetical protein
MSSPTKILSVSDIWITTYQQVGDNYGTCGKFTPQMGGG